MHQRNGLESWAGLLLYPRGRGQSAQFSMDQRKQLAGGVRIASQSEIEDADDVANVTR